MQNYQEFHASVERAAAKLRQWDSSETIQIISHLDADGISACAILIKALEKENRKYNISILQQLKKDKIRDLAEENSKYIIFADFGSGQIKDIAEFLKEKEMIILDHHQPEEAEAANILHINPHLNGINGSKEISGSGVVYLFAKALNKENESLAHLAIIGAIGDVQAEEGFMQLNQEILNTAIEKGKIKVEKGLNLFGKQTRPLHKALEYSSHPYIPGVSGSESGAIQFLNQLGIEPKDKNRWRRVIDLTEDEKHKLAAGIIMSRLGQKNPEDIFSDVYILPGEEEGSPMRDAREFATLLNACGRMNKASFGIGACLGNNIDKKHALETITEYKKEIVNAMNWYEDNKDKMMKGDNYMILNAEDKVLSTMIGTLASIISKSNMLKDGTYVLSIARAEADTTKASLRMSGMNGVDIDLRDIVKEIVDKVGGEAGGHKHAAGALIDTEKEADFIKAAQEVLSNKKI